MTGAATDKLQHDGFRTMADVFLRTTGGIAASLLTGALLVLAFDPFGLWPLIFVAFVPMTVAQHRLLPAAVSGIAPGIGIACLFAHSLSAGLAEGNVAWYYQLWPAYVAVLVAVLASRSRSFHRRTDYRWLPFSFPLAWVAINFLRNWSGVDFLAATWGSPVYALYSQVWFLQPLSIFGFFGLELLLLTVNFALARMAIALLDIKRDPAGKARHRGAAIRSITIALTLPLLWSGLSLVQLSLEPDEDTTIRVAAVQPNILSDPDEELRRDFSMTREAAQQGAQLVVWREGGLKFNPLETRTAELQALAAETGAIIVIGYRYQSSLGRHNEALVLTPEGRIHGPYGKTHPGRFAGDYSDTGGDFEVYDTSIGPLATIICYDLDFTDTAREMARLGARIVAVPSADVPAIARSHYTHLVFRAIENRLSLIKADNAFDSAIIDSYGRILALEVNDWTVSETKANAHGEMPPALIVADVPLGSADSIYIKIGDWVGWLAIIAMLAFFILSRFTGRLSSAQVQNPSDIRVADR